MSRSRLPQRSGQSRRQRHQLRRLFVEQLENRSLMAVLIETPVRPFTYPLLDDEPFRHAIANPAPAGSNMDPRLTTFISEHAAWQGGSGPLSTDSELVFDPLSPTDPRLLVRMYTMDETEWTVESADALANELELLGAEIVGKWVAVEAWVPAHLVDDLSSLDSIRLATPVDHYSLGNTYIVPTLDDLPIMPDRWYTIGSFDPPAVPVQLPFTPEFTPEGGYHAAVIVELLDANGNVITAAHVGDEVTLQARVLVPPGKDPTGAYTDVSFTPGLLDPIIDSNNIGMKWATVTDGEIDEAGRLLTWTNAPTVIFRQTFKATATGTVEFTANRADQFGREIYYVGSGLVDPSLVAYGSATLEITAESVPLPEPTPPTAPQAPAAPTRPDDPTGQYLAYVVLTILDVNGNEVQSVNVGDEFRLVAKLVVPEGTDPFSAWADFEFPQGMMTPVDRPHDLGLIHAEYRGGQFRNGGRIMYWTEDPYTIFDKTFRAREEGVATFTTSAPDHGLEIVYTTLTEPLDLERVSFGSTTLVIGPAAGVPEPPVVTPPTPPTPEVPEPEYPPGTIVIGGGPVTPPNPDPVPTPEPEVPVVDDPAHVPAERPVAETPPAEPTTTTPPAVDEPVTTTPPMAEDMPATLSVASPEVPVVAYQSVRQALVPSATLFQLIATQSTSETTALTSRSEPGANSTAGFETSSQLQLLAGTTLTSRITAATKPETPVKPAAQPDGNDTPPLSTRRSARKLS